MPPSLPAELDLGWPPPPFLAPPPAQVNPEGVRHFDGVTYATSPGYRPRLLDVHVPTSEEPVPAVVWIHGGGWLEGDRRYPPPTIPVELLHGSVLQAGLALVSIDYRHSLEAPFPAQLHDVKAAIRYVRRFADTLGIDGDRIAVWGESAGGHLAALSGLVGSNDRQGVDLEGSEGTIEESSSVRAVVDWYGVSELISLLSHTLPAVPGLDYPSPFTALLGGATGEELVARAAIASPVTHVTAGSPPPPFLLIHGTNDGLVPYSQSEALAEALEQIGADVTLQPVADADHIFLGAADVGPIVAQSVDFLVRHLTTAEKAAR
ncbi:MULTISPECIES: alpha/beta hydrolase [unclassified Streptomyces]|uniref:alpha/beta hydrolase n=1 Tax=unclassified Streptomyces TaxID=2593676 RepID=UPI002E82453D|nr:alpha/beta hydrolase [Streptomyces sp. NBC_00589]WTI42106.1 alpha/beta hydrolase [Streptomyces sp. NBC_00775]WUB24212.1 alpha/beta hydrolase [Streptomyces sp. NBC_00589]